MGELTVLGVSGGVSKPSKTTAVVHATLDALASRSGVRTGIIEVVEAFEHVSGTLSRADLGPTGEAIVRRIETADLIVVGTPVYRASYTGALKHLFDLVDHRALQGKPVVLTATGGSAHHGLMIEHQLRPLFAFFGAYTAPTTVYGAPDDFKDGTVLNDALLERVSRAADEALGLAQASRRSVSHARHGAL